jgi:hypothetical protein
MLIGKSREVFRASRRGIERYVEIPMPWTRLMYTPNHDDFGVRRPVFAIYWYVPEGSEVLCMRFGWTSRDAGPHQCRDGLKVES